MIRDVDRLTATTFDLLVVGGGIHGLAIAYDAAARGVSVALIERDDFGSGASFNHLRTIHGGLRYLQTLDVGRARESVRERRTLARIAPHAVRPLPFVLPLYRSLVKGKTAMRAGLALDRLVAFDRNRGVPAALRLPAGRVVSRETAVHRYPGLRRQGLRGAAIWHDYITVEADRLTFAWALAAVERGALLANHVEALAPLLEGQRVAGVRAAIGGRTIEISARLTVNATGSQVDRLREGVGAAAHVPLLKAMNLITSREAGNEALGGQSAAGRHLFLVPWRGRALFGTWESPRPCERDDAGIDERDVLSFIAELNQAFPSLDLTIRDVTHVHHAAVPAAAQPDGRVSLEGHERIHDDVEGMISVAGVKYTTARAVAERVTDLALRKLRRPVSACRTAEVALPGGDLDDVSLVLADARRSHDAGLPRDTIPHLVEAYGSRYQDVLAIAANRPDWRARVAPDSPVIGAELVWAARYEMAITLADAVIRRTPLGALGYPGDDAAQCAAAIVGAELGWSEERQRQEIDAVREIYRSAIVRVTEP